MPGYNHHFDCTCGWCLKGSSGGSWRDAAERFSTRATAQRFLERENADRSVASCYVAPNARCPVCQAAVFFYQNSFGSRVFFDELGPPWPKHPCTDMPHFKSRTASASFAPLKRRPRGVRIEIAEAVRAGMQDPIYTFWKQHSKQPSPVYVVRSALRQPSRSFLELEPLVLARDDVIFIVILADCVCPANQELVSFDGSVVSILNEDIEGNTFQARQIPRETFEALQAGNHA